jgi:hypothetical protein
VSRRFIATLLLLACLLGNVQAALACVPAGDCCPAGAPNECDLQAGVTAAVSAQNCCVAGVPVTSSVSVAIQPRHIVAGAAGSPAAINLATEPESSRLTRIPAGLGRSEHFPNDSLTYLRTARLRL